MLQPLTYWVPSIAPSGMAFYDGDEFPEWQGNLLVGSLKFRYLNRIVLDGEKVVSQHELIKDLNERIRDVKQAPDGSIYVVTDSTDGKVLRLTKKKS
jgi:glucose/arabinose dehydrogenase